MQRDIGKVTPMNTMTDATSNSGGAAAAGGFSFQASLGAIAGIHVLRGTPVQWTAGLTREVPCSVSFETSGPGDDLSLELTDGSTVEIQAKKALSADRQRFWPALNALCEGIHKNQCDFGILIVCPNSSRPVREKYSTALKRIGNGRFDDPSTEQVELADYLSAKGYDAEAVCARIRIRTVSAFEDAGDAITAAQAELAHVCADDRQVIHAWNALCTDALSAISNKDRRSLRSLSSCLRASQIDIAADVRDSPLSINDKLLRHTMSRTEQFPALGIPRPLPTDRGWLPLKAVVRNSSVQEASSAEKALAAYHSLAQKPRTGEKVVDASTVGTFRRLCVVVGGPGSGKSLLLKKVLAREFAKEENISIYVRLRDLATRMQKTGCGIKEGVLDLGLDTTEVTPEQFRAAHFSDIVLLCDGLDECGERQHDIASGLKDIATSNPTCRIVVTTRPIGYSTSELRDWRHYEIVPLAEADTAEHLTTLCRCVLDEEDAAEKDALPSGIRAYLKDSTASRMLARSPLLLTLGAALFLESKNPSKSKPELYRRIFGQIERAPAHREGDYTLPSKEIRNRVLNHLGWLICSSPLQDAEKLEKRCVDGLEQALGATRRQAIQDVQASFEYWEKKGLIERLRHSGVELIAFIHKTCGEFAAARHLSEIEKDEARQAMASVLSTPDWDEILDFATASPLASMLAEMLIGEFEADNPDEAKLTRLFRVLVRPETSLPPAERHSFLENVFALARSEDRQKAYLVGRCLTEHDLSRMPEAEQLASSLLEAPEEWTRLVGWAVLACHFPSGAKRGELEDALAHFMERSGSSDFFVPCKWIGSFGPLLDRGLFENFMFGALKVLLPNLDAEHQDRLIAEVSRSQTKATMNFRSRFSMLLHDLGREDASEQLRSSSTLPQYNLVKGLRHLPTFRLPTGFSSVLKDVVSSAFLCDDTSPSKPSNLKYLAAFFESAGVMDAPVDDVAVWRSDDARIDDVHSLLRATAYVLNLPAEMLTAEARRFIHFAESSDDDQRFMNVLEMLPKVDVAEVDWRRARDCHVDMSLVEGLVHHPSSWIQLLAARFMTERLHGDALRSACQRMLATGTGDTLGWAAALTADLADGCALLLQRLDAGPDAPGLRHLFDQLINQGCAVEPSHLGLLKKGLLDRSAETAESAARWCEETASSDDT